MGCGRLFTLLLLLLALSAGCAPTSPEPVAQAAYCRGVLESYFDRSKQACKANEIVNTGICNPPLRLVQLRDWLSRRTVSSEVERQGRDDAALCELAMTSRDGGCRPPCLPPPCQRVRACDSLELGAD